MTQVWTLIQLSKIDNQSAFGMIQRWSVLAGICRRYRPAPFRL